MSNAEQLEEVGISIEVANEIIAKAKALERLQSNKDFQTIITKGYFEKEAIRVVLARAMPQFSDDDSQKNLLADIDGIGRLRQYFMAITQTGRMAVRGLAEDEQTQEELLNESSGE